jgi:hypothetical protein
LDCTLFFGTAGIDPNIQFWNHPMGTMRRNDVLWTMAVAVIAVGINPLLKSIGLLPADVFRGLGVFSPGLPQIVFAPTMAFLLLLCFIKTGRASVFPIVGTLRALSLCFVFPANLEHSGTLLAAVVSGGLAAWLLNNPQLARSGTWLPALAGLYAGLYTACNYMSTLVFGAAAHKAAILAAPHKAIAIVIGSVLLGTLLGFVACWLMRPWQSPAIARLTPRFGT